MKMAFVTIASILYTRQTKWESDEKGRKELEKIVKKIKKEGKKRDFDCLLGLSGASIALICCMWQ
jgi:hypothetical protein